MSINKPQLLLPFWDGDGHFHFYSRPLSNPLFSDSPHSQRPELWLSLLRVDDVSQGLMIQIPEQPRHSCGAFRRYRTRTSCGMVVWLRAVIAVYADYAFPPALPPAYKLRATYSALPRQTAMKRVPLAFPLSMSPSSILVHSTFDIRRGRREREGGGRRCVCVLSDWGQEWGFDIFST